MKKEKEKKKGVETASTFVVVYICIVHKGEREKVHLTV